MPLWHNIAEMMDYYIPPMPSVYWIDVTRRCNLRCIMCPQSTGLRDPETDMSMAMFRDIIDAVRENQPLVKLYLSGEPLLHENLFDMIAYAGVQGCQTMIHTNATMLTRDVSEKLLLSSLTFLSLSFRRLLSRHLRLQMLTGTLSPASVCYRCDNTFREV